MKFFIGYCNQHKFKKGQMIIEYVVMFTIIVVVIILAATTWIKPSVDKLYQKTAEALNDIADEFVED